MKHPAISTVLVGLLVGFWLAAVEDCSAFAAEVGKRMLSHDVYFALKDNSPQAKKALLAGCKKFLSDHPGTVLFAAGTLVAQHQRDVNDRDFDVALHIVFKDKASHDKYQDAPVHHKFIEEFQDNWKSVRVFDSWLDAWSHGAMSVEADRRDKVKKLPLPDPAASFAGMIEGKVVAKHERGIVVAVEKVTKVWKTNKAENPSALVGKNVLVIGPQKDGRPVKTISRFLDSLKVGETVTIDVAHRKGEALTILELTEEQRQRISEK